MCSGWGQECEEGLGRLLQCTTVLTDVCFTGSRVFPQANNIRTVLLHGCFHTAVVWLWTSAPKVPPWPLQGRPAKVGGLLPASSPSDPAHLFILRDTHFEILNYKRTKGEVSATRLLCFWGLTSHPSAQTLCPFIFAPRHHFAITRAGVGSSSDTFWGRVCLCLCIPCSLIILRRSLWMHGRWMQGVCVEYLLRHRNAGKLMHSWTVMLIFCNSVQTLIYYLEEYLVRMRFFDI